MRVHAFGPFSFPDSEDDDRPKLSHDVQIHALREFHEAYKAPVTFRPGDLVTAKTNGSWSRAGKPRLVVEIRQDADFDFTSGETGSNRHGARKDMLVADVADDGTIACVWVESFDFEPYRQPGAQEEAA